MDEKLKQYAEEINKNGVGFINKKLVNAIIEMEEQGKITEMPYLKALEMLRDIIKI